MADLSFKQRVQKQFLSLQEAVFSVVKRVDDLEARKGTTSFMVLNDKMFLCLDKLSSIEVEGTTLILTVAGTHHRVPLMEFPKVKELAEEDPAIVPQLAPLVVQWIIVAKDEGSFLDLPARIASLKIEKQEQEQAPVDTKEMAEGYPVPDPPEDRPVPAPAEASEDVQESDFEEVLP